MAITITGKITGIGKSTLIPPPAPAGGDIGLFAGGDSPSGTVVATMEYINISSLGNTITFGDMTAGRLPAGASNTTTGIIAGGTDSEESLVNLIEYVTLSTPAGASTFGELSAARRRIATASNGSNDRVVLNSGSGSALKEYVTVSSLGDAVSVGTAAGPNHNLGSASNGVTDRQIYAGYWAGGGTTVNVIYYLTISTLAAAEDFGDLTEVRTTTAATSSDTNDRAVFSGGDSGFSFLMDYVTISSLGNASTFGNMIRSRGNASAVSNGVSEQGIIAGGQFSSSNNVMDYINISSVANSGDFGDLTTVRHEMGGLDNGLL